MEIIELTLLESQVNQLLQALDELRAENKMLRNQLTRHAREKNISYQNNRQAANNIKKIINSLQEILP